MCTFGLDSKNRMTDVECHRDGSWWIEGKIYIFLETTDACDLGSLSFSIAQASVAGGKLVRVMCGGS